MGEEEDRRSWRCGDECSGVRGAPVEERKREEDGELRVEEELDEEEVEKVDCEGEVWCRTAYWKAEKLYASQRIEKRSRMPRTIKHRCVEHPLT